MKSALYIGLLLIAVASSGCGKPFATSALSEWLTPPATLPELCRFAEAETRRNYKVSLEAKKKLFLDDASFEATEFQSDVSDFDKNLLPGGEYYQAEIAGATNQRLESRVNSDADPKAAYELAIRYYWSGEHYRAATYALAGNFDSVRQKLYIAGDKTIRYSKSGDDLMSGHYGPSVCLMKKICGDKFSVPNTYLNQCYS